jgi:hypothetical protein
MNHMMLFYLFLPQHHYLLQSSGNYYTLCYLAATCLTFVLKRPHIKPNSVLHKKICVTFYYLPHLARLPMFVQDKAK